MKATIAVDLGGTNVRVALIDENYNIVSILRQPTNHDGMIPLFEEIDSMINEIKKDHTNLEIISLSFGVPGYVRNGYIVEELINLGLKNVKVREYFEPKYNLPVYILNDADCAVIAEANIGKGKDYSKVFFITISTGIGAAFAIDGKVTNYCKEMGHMLIHYKDSLYDQESIASGHGLINLCKMNGLKIENTKELFDLYKDKNELATRIFEDWFNIINNFIKFIIKEFKPDIIKFTGGVMKSKDLFFDRLIKENPNTLLAECECKEDAGIIGAGIYGFIANN